MNTHEHRHGQGASSSWLGAHDPGVAAYADRIVTIGDGRILSAPDERFSSSRRTVVAIS